jgi:hypothetical protein
MMNYCQLENNGEIPRNISVWKRVPQMEKFEKPRHRLLGTLPKHSIFTGFIKFIIFDYNSTLTCQHHKELWRNSSQAEQQLTWYNVFRAVFLSI